MTRLALSVSILAALMCAPESVSGNIVLNFNDVAPGTLTVSSPYQNQGFTLTSSSGGFVFNSPDTGNGSTQTVGSNGYYAGANGLAAFSPATITLTQTDGAPFSLVSIDLARIFAFDPADPTVMFTGSFVGGGTTSETVTVSTAAGFPGSFETFNSSNGLAGLANLTSLSWDQPVFISGQGGLNQFTNITLSTVPEPSSLVVGAVASLLGLGFVWCRHRGRSNRCEPSGSDRGFSELKPRSAPPCSQSLID
jgi:hypothetical protein